MFNSAGSPRNYISTLAIALKIILDYYDRCFLLFNMFTLTANPRELNIRTEKKSLL